MAIDGPSSDREDPLIGYSGASLFLRTFSDSSTISKPASQESTESIHSYLKSMALRSSTVLVEQAKSILDGGSELLNPSFQSKVASEENSGFISEKRKENLPERRPALGRKRARFSLKPDSSQPTTVLEPSLDIDKLQDPEEYFLAHEKLGNAKKELQRQRRGVLMDLNQHNPSTTTWRRRPGLLGRSVSYKHHYSSLVSDNDENLILNPASAEQEMVSRSNYSSQVEMVNPNMAFQERELTETVDPIVESQERELTVSVTKAENKVDEILDELLSGNCEDLDGDGALTLLQERLQIKPIDLNKLCLPELHNIQQNDFKSSGVNWLRHRDSFSDIKTMLTGLSSKTPMKNGQVAESPVHPLASPTPPKSPFASISLLKRHILRSNLTSDPFSVLKVNLSPVRNSSFVASSDERDKIDDGKDHSFSEKLKSVIHEGDDIAGATKGSHNVVHVMTQDSTPSSENAVDNDSGRLGLGINSRLTGSHADVDVNIRNNNVDEDIRRLNADTDVQINKTNELQGKVGDMLQEAVLHAHPDRNIEDSTLEKLNGSESHGDQPTSAVVEDQDRDGPSKTAYKDPEQQSEEILEPSDESLKKRSRAKAPSRGERGRKEISRRQSLAEAGTLWSSGVRRSTRIKMRPLQYWKGERFLFGRIHRSLTSVIGVKYASPAKNGGEPTIKVKSFVSDEYRELVDTSALH